MSAWIEKITIGATLDRAAERFGLREALAFGGRRWSFDQVQLESNRAARGLIASGVEPGETVALWLTNRPEWIQAFFGAAKIGAVFLPINTRFRTTDVEYVLRQSDSTTLILPDRSGPIDYLAIVRDLIPELRSCRDPNDLRSAAFPALRRVIVLSESAYPGTRRWKDVLAAGDALPDQELAARQRAIDPDATVLLMYTSGTTGFPKGVVHNHDLLHNASAHQNRMGVRADDVILTYLPLFHLAGLHQGPLMSIVSGARVVLMEQYDPSEALRLIAAERATRIQGFDAHFLGLMEHPQFGETDTSSLRTGLQVAGLARSEPVVRRTQAVLCPTVSGYGMTELGVAVSLGFPDDSDNDRCTMSGVALPGWEFKIVEPDTGEIVSHGTPGELCCRGYGMMQGYYKEPEETAKAIDAEGWMHTGDMAVMRDDETIRFLGRYKDMLKVGGENVDAAEVEALLLEHPAVQQVAVVGVSDTQLTEVACACVLPERGQTATADELLEHCRGRIASFKIPRHVLFVDEYPVTSTGKVQKYKLREICTRELGLT